MDIQTQLFIHDLAIKILIGLAAFFVLSVITVIFVVHMMLKQWEDINRGDKDKD